MQEKILFVTKGGEDSDNGFSYAVELAKTLNTGIAVLMVYSKHAATVYEDVMAAVAFVEAGDTETVKSLMREQEEGIKKGADKKIKEFVGICEKNSLSLVHHTAFDDTVTAIKLFLKERPFIDMVLLSPNLSADRKGIDFKKLLKNITKPIVAVSALAKVEA
jgi:hypothetical protein